MSLFKIKNCQLFHKNNAIVEGCEKIIEVWADCQTVPKQVSEKFNITETEVGILEVYLTKAITKGLCFKRN